MTDKSCPLTWQLRVVGWRRGQDSLSTSTPHVGRLSHQVKLLREATSPRIVSGIVHLSAKNVQELKRTPGR
jgi:hypothetical protein